MAKARVQVGFGGRQREFQLHSRSIVIGSADDCDLRLPFEWVRPRHLEIKYDAGVARMHALPGAESVMSDGKPLRDDWAILHTGTTVHLRAPNAQVLSLRFEFPDAPAASSLAHDAPARTEPVDVGVPVEWVTESDVAEGSMLFGGPSASLTPTASPAPAKADEPPPKVDAGTRRVLIVSGTFLATLLVVIGVLFAKQWHRRSQAQGIAAEVAAVSASVEEARKLITAGNYREAQAKLEDARTRAGDQPNMADVVREIEAVRQRPEIRYGANGYVRLDAEWVPGERARGELAARKRNGPKLDALWQEAQTALNVLDQQAGQRACDEAIAILATHPLQPNPRTAEFKALRAAIEDKVVSAAMTAKGLVRFENKWVSPEEHFKLSQAAKGLVEYRGQWVPKDEAFAAEQMDKGLVLHDGKWITPEQQMEAKGFVQFDGKWVTPQERDALLQQQTMASAEAQRKAEAERQRLEAEAKEKQEAAEQIEELKTTAYRMSQEFIKDDPEFPRTATFPDIKAAGVTVTHDGEWYVVNAYTEARASASATPQKRRYTCKLRPLGGSQWEADEVKYVE